MVKLFKKEEGVIRKISDSYSVLNLLTAKDSSKVSVDVSTATNHFETTRSTSDRAHYILEGEITINNQTIARTGEVIYVPANEEYTFQGSFKSVLINSPAFKKTN